MTGGPILAVAHRAGNSLASLRAALDAGVDLVEADVRLFRTALEVRHDLALGRHLFWDWGLAVNRRRDVLLPELADVLTAAAGDPRLMLDLKGPGLTVAPHVAALLRQLVPGVPVTVCTKQWRMLDAFDGDHHVRRVFSASTPGQLARLLIRLRGAPAFGVSVRRHLLTPGVVAELRRRAGVVMTWPVDTEAAFEHACRLGATGVISKNLDLLRRVATTNSI